MTQLRLPRVRRAVRLIWALFLHPTILTTLYAEIQLSAVANRVEPCRSYPVLCHYWIAYCPITQCVQ